MLFKNNNFLCLSEGMGVSTCVFFKEKSVIYTILMLFHFFPFFIGLNHACGKFRTLQNMFLFRHVFFVIYYFTGSRILRRSVRMRDFFVVFLSYCNTNICLSNVCFSIVFSRLFQHIIFLKKMRKKYCKKF